MMGIDVAEINALGGKSRFFVRVALRFDFFLRKVGRGVQAIHCRIHRCFTKYSPLITFFGSYVVAEEHQHHDCIERTVTNVCTYDEPRHATPVMVKEEQIIGEPRARDGVIATSISCIASDGGKQQTNNGEKKNHIRKERSTRF